MKLSRTYLIITISSVALIIVLMIQVNWILQSAHIKEELFNEKANMVLSKTAEALSADKVMCQNIESGIGKSDRQKIDSLFEHYMAFYNFRIAYSFDVRPRPFTLKNPATFENYFIPEQAGCYKKKLDDVVTKNGLELKLIFPEKKQYILEEMGVPFVASVILIIVVLVMFCRTILSLTKEKKIAEHTTDFLNNMTHEFKTPLTNIALAGKMITKESTIHQEDKVRHYSGIILEENEKLRLQVEQVLSMTALERGEIPLQKTEVDLHQLIREGLKWISLHIENTHGDLEVSLDAHHVVVFGDKTHLANAFCNLIDNAIKYSKDHPQISVQTVNSGQNIMIRISDQGIGIEKKYHKKVFHKFFRVPTGDRHDVKGFGLGLAYVKKIIDMHGGKIELTSDTLKGTLFTIILPNV